MTGSNLVRLLWMLAPSGGMPGRRLFFPHPGELGAYSALWEKLKDELDMKHFSSQNRRKC